MACYAWRCYFCLHCSRQSATSFFYHCDNSKHFLLLRIYLFTPCRHSPVPAAVSEQKPRRRTSWMLFVLSIINVIMASGAEKHSHFKCHKHLLYSTGCSILNVVCTTCSVSALYHPLASLTSTAFRDGQKLSPGCANRRF